MALNHETLAHGEMHICCLVPLPEEVRGKCKANERLEAVHAAAPTHPGAATAASLSAKMMLPV